MVPYLLNPVRVVVLLKVFPPMLFPRRPTRHIFLPRRRPPIARAGRVFILI